MRTSAMLAPIENCRLENFGATQSSINSVVSSNCCGFGTSAVRSSAGWFLQCSKQSQSQIEITTISAIVLRLMAGTSQVLSLSTVVSLTYTGEPGTYKIMQDAAPSRQFKQ